MAYQRPEAMARRQVQVMANEPATLIRRRTVRDAYGKPSAVEDPVSVMVASAPGSGTQDEQVDLTERGVQAIGARTFWLTDEVTASGEDLPGDVILYKSRRYLVRIASDWGAFTQVYAILET